MYEYLCALLKNILANSESCFLLFQAMINRDTIANHSGLNKSTANRGQEQHVVMNNNIQNHIHRQGHFLASSDRFHNKR